MRGTQAGQPPSTPALGLVLTWRGEYSTGAVTTPLQTLRGSSHKLTQAPSVSSCPCLAQPRRTAVHRALIAGAVTPPHAPAALCSQGPRPHAGGWHHTDSSLAPQHCCRSGLLPIRRELLKRRAARVPLQVLHLRCRSQPPERRRLEPDHRVRPSGRGPALGRGQHPCHQAGTTALEQSAMLLG